MNQVIAAIWSPGAKLEWAAIVFFALLIGAVFLEVLRQTIVVRGRVRSQWRIVSKIVKERGLSSREWTQLRALIRYWAPREPLRTVTVRQQFDMCVEAEMEALFAKGNTRQVDTAGATLRDIRERLGLDYIPFGQRIHSTRELYGGQPVWISRASEKTPKWFQANVSHLDEAYFHVTTHDNTQDMPTLRPGESTRCRIWRDEDARYVFTTPFVRSEDNPPTWVFRHASDLNRMQARAHFRVRHDQSTPVTVLSASVDGNVENLALRPIISKLRGRITSLSAGGIALVIQQTLPKQVILRVMLDLPDSEPVELHARVVSYAHISGERCFIRATFVGIGDETRDKIARYVLRRQQPLRDTEEKAD